MKTRPFLSALWMAVAGALLFAPAVLRAQSTDADSSTTVELESNTDSNTQSDKPAAAAPAIRHEALVVVGKDVELKAGETAGVVVAIGGSVRVLGKVHGPAVAIGGDIDVQGEVRDVAVAVMGNVAAGPRAVVEGDAISVGGTVTPAEGARIRGQVTVMDFGLFGFASPEWLRMWFRECVMKLRPLAIQVPWIWAVAGVILLVYFLTTVVFRRPVHSCAEELTNRPASTFLLGILTLLLIPVVFVILAATGLGLIVIPFLVAALFLGAILGKVGLLEAFGASILRRFQTDTLQRPFVAFLLGSLVLVILYIIPIIGGLAFLITGVWGLGGAVAAAFGGLRRELPPRIRAARPLPVESPVAAYVPLQPATAGGPSSFAATSFEAQTPGVASAIGVAPSPLPPQVPEIVAYPRAGFWERMAAAFLDTVLVSVVGAVAGGPPLLFVIALAYFAGMWAWKGTTIGGIVLGLKVVRVDQQPVTVAVAVVRALAGAFSIVVLFLGILWIAWDPEKQGWHDRIAGTAVLKLPRGTPLI